MAGIRFLLGEVESLTQLTPAEVSHLFRLVLVQDGGTVRPPPHSGEIEPVEAALVWLANLLGQVGLGTAASRAVLLHTFFNELLNDEHDELETEDGSWSFDIWDRRHLTFPGLAAGAYFDLETAAIVPEWAGAEWVELLTYDVARLYRRNARVLLERRRDRHGCTAD